MSCRIYRKTSRHMSNMQHRHSCSTCCQSCGKTFHYKPFLNEDYTCLCRSCSRASRSVARFDLPSHLV